MNCSGNMEEIFNLTEELFNRLQNGLEAETFFFNFEEFVNKPK